MKTRSFLVALLTVRLAIGLSICLASEKEQRTSPVEPKQCKIYFSRDEGRDKENLNIWVMDPDGSEIWEERLTNRRFNERGICLSKDKALYEVEIDKFTNTDIWKMNLDGSGQKCLIENATHSSVARDGTIYFQSNEKIYRRNPDGTVTLVIPGPGKYVRPLLTRDEQWLVFQAYVGGNFEIRKIRPDGSDETKITKGDSPLLSPDGKWIAFQRNGNVYIVPFDGGKPRQLTDSLGEDLATSWSPDGEYLFIQTNRNGNWDVYKIKVADGSYTPLTFDPANDKYACYFPWGRLGFISDRTGNNDIWDMNPDDGSDKRNLTNYPGKDGFMTYLCLSE